MREAPDVIMIGEIRDRETMQQAIAYAETGPSVPEHPAREQREPGRRPDRELLPGQSPAPAPDGPVAEPQGRGLAAPDARRERRRIPAVELLLQTPYVSDLILKARSTC
jgi:twitching motility protein PilU